MKLSRLIIIVFPVLLDCLILQFYPCSQAKEIIVDNKFNRNIKIEYNQTVNVENISGGTISHNKINQFYGFIRFNIGAGNKVYFLDPGVKNILVRVTQYPSLINGTLGVSGGNANLFLLNPNGITFGSGARLDLNGSFLATTASSIIFSNGSTFDVSLTDTSSLLNVSIPVGIRFGTEVKPIEVKNVTLRIKPENTLALLGGNLNILNSIISTPGSKIELAGIGENGFIDLNLSKSIWEFNYKSSPLFKDVTIDNSIISTFGGNILNENGNLQFFTEVEIISEKAGDINITGREIEIIDKKFDDDLYTDINTDYVGRDVGGNINITASGLLRLDNVSLTATTADKVSGKSGNINLNAHQILTNFSIINASSEGVGSPGQIYLKADDLIYLDSTAVSSQAFGLLFGLDSGFIAFDSKFLVLNGSIITASSRNSGGSNFRAGNIEINSHVVLAANKSAVAAGSSFGQGGRVLIRTEGFFKTPDSQIIIASELGRDFDGTVVFDITSPDPSSALNKLPITVVDPQTLVSQNPCRRSSFSEFSNMGRGGLPVSVDQDQNPDAVQMGLVEAPDTTITQPSTLPLQPIARPTSPSTTTAAQGWQFNDNGKVLLLAHSPEAAGAQRLKAAPEGCLP